MSAFDLVIRQARVATASDCFEADIGIRDGRIEALGAALAKGRQEIDAAGRVVTPGGVDAHCHLDQPMSPPLRMADDFESGTRSAACGGTTTVIPFAAQEKGQSLRAAVDDYHRRAEGKAHIDYAFHMIVSDPTPTVLNDELPSLIRAGYTSFKVYMTYDKLKLDDYQQLLFVNQLGIKQVGASFEEFAWQFSSAQISAVVAAVPLIEWSAERLNGLAEQYRERQQAREAEHQARLAEQLRITEERDQARRKALKEARLLAAAQQQREAEKVALRQTEADLEQARRDAVAAEHGASEEQRRQRARLLVSGLTMGAWLSFHDDNGQQTRRKLAVVLPSSGKYIFVDRIGTEKYEMTRDVLISEIAAGAIEVVRKDSRFDDALNRVVDGIRQDRGWGNG